MIKGTADKLLETYRAAQARDLMKGTEIERELRKRAANVLAAAASYAINDTEANDQTVLDAVRLLLKLRIEVKGEL